MRNSQRAAPGLTRISRDGTRPLAWSAPPTVAAVALSTAAAMPRAPGALGGERGVAIGVLFLEDVIDAYAG